MGKILLLLSLLAFSIPQIYAQPTRLKGPESYPISPEKRRFLGKPVFIRIIKEEKKLELFVKDQGSFQFVQTYPICSYSGSLGPKRLQGDFKSPEGFYQVTMGSLNPNSKFYRSFDLGYPNQFDKAHGFTGKYLMVHGDCVSQGCYAMTNRQIAEIYQFIEYALLGGQSQVEVNIFPFRMTEENMRRYSHSVHYDFWQQLKPGYDFFERTHQPPSVTVANGRYSLVSPELLANRKTASNNRNPFAQ